MSPMVNSSVPDRLKDYVDVKERIRLFYEAWPDGRLVTTRTKIKADPDGVVRVWAWALAYRTPDDPLPGTGVSYLAVPGKTPYTAGSEIENVETSAWGRAIGCLGLGIAKSIASADEVAAKEGDDTAPARTLVESDGSLIGTGEVAKDFPDFLPKQSPDGMVLAFKLVSPAGGIKVIARGLLAEVLPGLRSEIIGARVICWGRVSDETFRPKNAKRDVTYQVLDLERIRTESGTLPMETPPPAVEERPEAVPEPLGLGYGE